MFMAEALARPFLGADNEEYARYSGLSPQYPREVTNASPWAGAAAAKPIRLTQLVTQRTDELRHVQGLYGYAVKVADGDGLSWTATAVDEALAKHQPGLHRVRLADRGALGSRPALFAALHRGDVLDAAAQSGFCKEARRRPWWAGPAAALTLIALGIAIALAKAYADRQAKTSTVETLFSAQVLIPLGLLGVLGIAVKVLERHLFQTTSEEELERRLVDALNDEDRLSASKDELYGFRNRMVKLLAGLPFPRVVIIDGYDRLDWLTREVTEQYVRTEAGRAAANSWELWVVFERQSSQEFWQRVFKSSPGDDGFFRLRPLQLQHLSVDRRRTLAEHLGHPERRTYKAVKDLSGPADSVVSSIRAALTAYRADRPPVPGQTSPLEVLYLLALTSYERGSPTFNQRFLRRSLSGHADKERGRMLARFLPGGIPSPTEVDELVAGMLESFPECVREEESGGNREFRVLEAAGEVLVRDHDALRLPPPGRGHAFWAVFWRDHFDATREAYWVRRVAFHIQPATVSAGAPPALSQALYRTAYFAGRESLRKAFVDDIQPLMARTAQLVPPSQQRQAAELCWEAYALTGGDDLLALILDLAPELLGRHGRRRKLDESESSLFEIFTGTVAQSVREAPQMVLDAADDFFVDCGLARAAWVSATLSWLFPDEADEWVTSAATLESTLPALCHRVVSRLDPILTSRVAGLPKVQQRRRAEVRLVTDLFTLSLATWAATLCLAAHEVRRRSLVAPLAALTDTLPPELLERLTQPAQPIATELVQTLESSALVVDSLLASSPDSGNSGASDLVIEGLARELAAFCRAGVAVLRRALPTIDSDRLGQVLALVDAATGEQLQPAVQRVERELYVLHLAWNALGFTQLAETLALRGAQASAVLGGTSRDWLAPLRIATERGGISAFFAWSTEAAVEVPKGENRAVRAYNALVELLSASSGTLLLEGSLFTVAISNLFPIDQTPILRRLSENHGHELEILLGTMQDERVPECAVMLGNALLSSSVTAEGLLIMRLLEDRAARMGDAHAAARAGASIRAHTFALKIAHNEEVSIDAEVAAWPFPREGSSYAFMLGLLFDAASGERSHVASVAIELLEHAGPFDRASSNYAALAARVVTWLDDEGLAATQEKDLELCLDLLEEAASRLDDGTAISVMLGLYTVLVASERNNPGHRTKREHYQREQMHRDEVQLIRPFLGAGRYFEVFQYYAETLMRWRLPCVGDQDVKRLFTASEESKRVAAQQWVARGEAPPRPFASDEGRTVLNGSFLAIGAGLLNVGDGDAEIAAARQAFERLAYEGLSRLLRAGAELPSMGPSLRSMLDRHRAQFAPPSLSRPA